MIRRRRVGVADSVDHRDKSIADRKGVARRIDTRDSERLGGGVVVVTIRTARRGFVVFICSAETRQAFESLHETVELLRNGTLFIRTESTQETQKLCAVDLGVLINVGLKHRIKARVKVGAVLLRQDSRMKEEERKREQESKAATTRSSGPSLCMVRIDHDSFYTRHG